MVKDWRSHALRMWLTAIVLLVVVLTATKAQQSTGDILGTVTDSSGAAIPNASVVIENLGTHQTRDTTTNADGDYVVNLLLPGNYSVTITATNFTGFKIPSMTLAAGDRARFNAALNVGEITQTISVEANASALQTDSSVLSNTIVETSVQDLPLNGRNLVQLIQEQPGVNEGQPASLTNGNELDDNRSTASFAANGQTDAMNNQMIDGLDNNERWVGTIGVRPSIEAISEMNVQTSNYGADVSRTGGGVVDVITKSGTNDFHGSAFEYFRNDILDAKPFSFGQILPKGEFRQNQFGASIGGPIRKDKTFFFGDYEGIRKIAQQQVTLTAVPSLFEHNHPGNFSDIGGPIICTSPGTPAGCTGMADRAGLAYFELYPAPNVVNSNGNFFAGAAKDSQSGNTVDARLDQQISENDQLFVRFDFNDFYTNNPGSLPSAPLLGTNLIVNPNVGGYYAPQLDSSIGVGYTHTFSSRLLLTLRLGYTRDNNQSFAESSGQNPNAALGQPGINTSAGDCSGLVFALPVDLGTPLGFGCVFNPDLNLDNVYEFNGDVVYTRGNHNMKFGGDVILRKLRQVQSPFAGGQWLFGGPTGSGLASLVEGISFSVSRNADLFTPHYQSWEPGFFFEDDWHVRRNLTLNLGLRWDFFQPLTEAVGRISNWDPVTQQLLVAGQNGVSKYAGIQPRYTDFAPRVGFAYTIGKGLVVRGGYGISYSPENIGSSGSLKNPPFVSSANFNFVQFQNGLPAPIPETLSQPGASIPDAESLNFHDSLFQQFNLTVQKDFSGNVLTLSYVNLRGQHIAQIFPDYNAPPPNSLGFPAANSLRPAFAKFPNLGTVGFTATEGISNYNALNASFERRLKAGLTLNANYTQAHNLDDSPGYTAGGAANGGFGTIPLQPRKFDYGNSVLDIRNHFAAGLNYSLPFGKSIQSAVGKALVTGWQTNLIAVWSGGIPFSVLNSTDVSNTVNGGTDRPNYIPQAGAPPAGHFFNPADFQVQQAGTYGVLATCSTPGCYTGPTVGTHAEPRNVLHGPDFRHVDLSVFKIFPLVERFSLEFRAEIFNISNTPSFGLPGSTIGTPTFGELTSTSANYTPREVQFALKLRF